LIAGVAVALAGYLALAFLTSSAPYLPIDLAVSRAVQAINYPWFDFILLVVGWPGFPPQVAVEVALLILAIYLLGRRRDALYLVGTTIGIAIMAQGSKMLIDRPRPTPDLIRVLNPDIDGGRWGYPAGHVADYVAILGFVFFIAYISPRPSIGRALTLVVTAVMIALVGLSRIYVGEHWFTDALGGYLLGAAWLAVVIYWYRRRTPPPASAAPRAGGPA
jgi:membrane-associated phospholipid phosphatase